MNNHTEKTLQSGITCILAEKPSVAREIAKIVGATSRQDGYIEGNNYIVTWALGHLVGLAIPGNDNAGRSGRENLPLIPETFTLQPRQVKAAKGYKADPGALKQLRVIKKTFDKCDSIISGTDSAREGELIFRYIYHYLGCTKPFKRLWINSLTEKAIREGLNNLRPGADYDNLYYAAKSRSEADLLVGINASRALSVTAGDGIYSLGRVQTPTLAMICFRYKENKQFVPQKYFQLALGIEKDTISFKAQSKEKYADKEEADRLYQLLKANPSLEIKKVDKKAVSEEAPLLFDLTGLQKKANSLFGFSADKTLGIAQVLYEKKLITYPRTGSKYISEDVFEQIPGMLKSAKTNEKYGEYTTKLLEQKNTWNKQAVDNSKVTDHHALLVTDSFPCIMNKEERQIYELIICRMLEALSAKCQKEQTTVLIVSNDMEFEAKGSVIIDAGWRAVQIGQADIANKEANNEESNNLIPKLSENETLHSTGCSLMEKQTKPKPLFTESSLLSAMEHAGRELDDEAQRKAMKDCGLGTPATRAAIIETLISRGYMIRREKTLVPTEKGMAIYGIVKNMRIADVEMTGMWEETLAKIERGEFSAETFIKSIGVYTSQVTSELLSSNIVFKEKGSDVSCPKCREGKIRFYPMVARCGSEHCDFICFRTKAGKTLTDTQLAELFEKKKLGPLSGFKSKAGNDFEASLVLDEEMNVKFVFPEKKNNDNSNYKKGKGKPKK